MIWKTHINYSFLRNFFSTVCKNMVKKRGGVTCCSSWLFNNFSQKERLANIWCGSWDMERNGQNFLSFWTTLYPFTPLNTWKIKILKTWKKSQEIVSFYTYLPQMAIIWCMLPEIGARQIFLSFWAIFCPVTH